MPSVPRGNFEDDLWELESDLSSLANQAAIEIDNLILKRENGFGAVRRLAARLASGVSSLPGTSSSAVPYDPVTVGVINRAIDELIPNQRERPETTEGVLNFATKIIDKLNAVARDAQSQSVDELKKLRQSCLALSESASTFQNLPQERSSEQPF